MSTTPPHSYNSAKISVIIPSYNEERYLGKCLDSVLKQTHTNLEIIIIDDGSVDNTVKIAEEFALLDKRIIIKKQKNQGVSIARNEGLAIATGDYVHFMDADDYAHFDFYEKLLAAAVKSDADIAMSNTYDEKYAYTYYDLRMPFTREFLIMHPSSKMRLVTVTGGAWSYFYKREFLSTNELQFSPKYRYLEDYLFVFQSLVLARRVVLVPEAVYYFHYNLNSTTRGSRLDLDRRAQDCKNAFAERDEIIAKNGLERQWELVCESVNARRHADIGTNFDQIRSTFTDINAKIDWLRHAVQNLGATKSMNRPRRYPRWIIRLICCFVPKKKNRQMLRVRHSI